MSWLLWYKIQALYKGGGGGRVCQLLWTNTIYRSRTSKDRQRNDQMFASTKGVIRSRNSKRDRQRNYQTFEDTKEVIISRKSKDRKHNGQMLENIKGVIRNRKSKNVHMYYRSVR